MTIRQINRLTRDGGNGRNVYHNDHRVTHAKSSGSTVLVRHLLDGKWHAVRLFDQLEIR